MTNTAWYTQHDMIICVCVFYFGAWLRLTIAPMSEPHVIIANITLLTGCVVNAREMTLCRCLIKHIMDLPSRIDDWLMWCGPRHWRRRRRRWWWRRWRRRCSTRHSMAIYLALLLPSGQHEKLIRNIALTCWLDWLTLLETQPPERKFNV